MGKLITYKCTSCGGDVAIAENKREFYCIYCGTKNVIVADYISEEHHFDEAEIQKSKDSKEIELERLRIEEAEKKRAEKSSWIIVGVCFTLVIVGIVVLMLMERFKN